MITVKGYIDRIIFRNPDNGYTVMKLSTDDGDITVVGLLSMAGEGELITAEGEITYHSGYGEQLEAERITVQEPDNKESILRFLSSRIVRGIGPALAGRIVERFGDDTFGIMSREPERLAEVKGISLRKAVEISESFEEIAGMRRAVMFLQQYGISNLLSLRIYERYGEKLYEIISENPYRLCGDISGIGFKTADEIAERSGIERHSEYRIRAGILYALSLSASEGNTYLPLDRLLREASDVLSLPENEIRDEIPGLQEMRKAEIKQRDGETRVYLRNLYRAEKQCAAMLISLDIKYDIDRERLVSDIERTEERYSLTLDPDQREAVISALENGLFIMTGGPGTGKTTTIKILLRYLLSIGKHVCLAAPTGRAAKRLSEATGMEAKTIHRLLEVAGGNGDESGERQAFGRGPDNPLETDVVIVDEMSMVDILLFKALLSAIPVGTRLIMVGDENQLPSVGPGSVLKDILSTGKFKSIALNKIFRQAEESDIVMNAHALLSGRDMKLDNKSRDFFFLNRSDAGEITEGVIYLVTKKLPPYVEASSSEIQVLTPMRKGVMGVENLNRVLQNAVNPPAKGKAELNRGEFVLREGDRVMQNRNNYQMAWVMDIPGKVLKKSGTGVFNGDLGIIEEINRGDSSLTVRFEDNRRAQYSFKDLPELELSYAVTIHKSQGSEYPAVVMPVFNGPDILMSRNLLYTGITRAKRCVVIIGRKEMLLRMAENVRKIERYTGLDREILWYDENS